MNYNTSHNKYNNNPAVEHKYLGSTQPQQRPFPLNYLAKVIAITAIFGTVYYIFGSKELKRPIKLKSAPKVRESKSEFLEEMTKMCSPEAEKARNEDKVKRMLGIIPEDSRESEQEPEPILTEKESLSDGNWYISSLLILVHNKFPKRSIYTIESVVHKYKLGSNVRILPKEENSTERRSPHWDIEYTPPRDRNPEEYFILYEQLGENSWNEIDPRFGEFKGEQDFLVIRSNTKVVELHLCKLENENVKFLKEVITSQY